MRIINALKNYGFLRFIIKFFKKLTYKIFAFFDKLDLKMTQKHDKKKRREKKEKYRKIKILFNSPQYKYIFVFYPYTEWNLPIFQRPQQIALAMTQNRNDVLYFFCTTNYEYDSVDIIEQINNNLYLCTDYDFLTNIESNKRVIHLYSTDIVSKVSTVQAALDRNDKVVYEYIDEIHEDITQSIPEFFFEKHKFILRNENCYVVTTASKLFEDVKKERTTNFILSTNGVNLNDFVVPKDSETPKIIKQLRAKYEKIIGYYGALAKWFDYNLLNKVAKAYPNYAIVLIGIEYDDSLKHSHLLENPNIHFLGKIEYTKLIQYSSNMDLLTIPFLINEITESTSPVKLFEYMATQKPILTTAMSECKKYKSVNIANSHEEFIKKIPETINLSNNNSYIQLLSEEAKQNTWIQKSNAILDMLSK